MRKYYKLFFLPAVVIIIAGIFSGFRDPSFSQIAENLLKERTSILQEAYLGRMEREKAEQRLAGIETYPLLSEDTGSLREFYDTDLDAVKSMELIDVKEENKQFHYVSLRVAIRWHMSGNGSGYVCDQTYSVILEETRGGYKLAEFNPIEE